MAKQRKPPKLLKAIFALQKSEDARPNAVDGAGLDPQLAWLRSWQTRRLENTYADLLSSAEQGPACRFFLSEVYAARDFSQRDANGEQLHALLRRYLPDEMLRPLTEALALNRMTNDLDADLLYVLVHHLGVTEEITAQAYAEAYRLCDNYQERLEQIDRAAALLLEVGHGAKLPLVGLTLKLVRRPAQRLGWSEAYDFLARGYAAFEPMKDAGEFVNTIERREKLILDRIYSGHPEPFSVS
jgi:hypothetical protein